MQKFFFQNGHDHQYTLGIDIYKSIYTSQSTLARDFLQRYDGYYTFTLLSYDAFEDKITDKKHDVKVARWSLVIPRYVHHSDNGAERFYQQNEEGVAELSAEEFKKRTYEDLNVGEIHTTEWSNPVDFGNYQECFRTIQKYLQRGDIYEVNYCVPFYCQAQIENSFAVFQKMQSRINAPFAGYFDTQDKVLLSFSPERFLRKMGDRLISQPIKGTAARSDQKDLDVQLKENLRKSQKEKSENVMIVDLVRNDLSRIAQKNTVHVDELFGIYSFSSVHQMISTISCKVREELSLYDILKATFPMGSMTGAPKISAMKIIEEVEVFNRGWYSGTLGLLSPNGDFDFNVIIRSLVYDKKTNKLQCGVGGAITVQADAEQEYQECLLKLKGIKDAVFHCND